MAYVRITQDGAGRILIPGTSSEYQGLYTDEIETCIVFVLKGEKGVSLIHKSNMTSIEDIVAEFKEIGKIEEGYLAYNKTFFDQSCSNIDLKSEFNSVYIKLEEDQKKLLQFDKALDAENGHLSVDKNFVITTKQKPDTILETHKQMTYDPDSKSRDYVRNIVYKVNNFFLGEAESIKLDIQFDGENFSNLFLNKNKDEIKKLMASDKFRKDKDTKDWVKLVIEMRNSVLTQVPGLGDRFDIQEVSAILDDDNSASNRFLENLNLILGGEWGGYASQKKFQMEEMSAILDDDKSTSDCILENLKLITDCKWNYANKDKYYHLSATSQKINDIKTMLREGNITCIFFGSKTCPRIKVNADKDLLDKTKKLLLSKDKIDEVTASLSNSS